MKINQVSFTSTYQIDLAQQGINATKRENLTNYISRNYDNYKISKSNTGTAKISMEPEQDAYFEQEIRRRGFKVFKKFPAHNVPAEHLESTIAKFIRRNDFVQKGKQKRSSKLDDKL